jgi:hypothetical protein
MSLDNKESIKFYSFDKSSQFLKKIEDNSNEVIGNIKSKIKNMNLYELYSENLNVINNINNKTNIEFINDIYNNIICNITNVKPEYYNPKSDIIKNRNKLFEISNNIIKEINTEIKNINNYITNYINEYEEKNLYNIYYNLYNIRKFFLNDEMNNLLNQFYLLVNNTINIHYKGMIYYNFYLVFQVFDEENEFFNDYSYKKRRVLTSGFDKRYEQYIAKFEEYLYMTFSYNFLNFIEKYFYKLRDDILNHIKDKLLVLNKYYFDTEKYKNKFYFIRQTYNEIFNFIDNINMEILN